MIIWELASPPETDWGALQVDQSNEEVTRELSMREKMSIIDDISEFGKLKLVFSGGDLFRQRGFFDLVSYATTKGLKVSVRPSVSNSVTKKSLRNLQQAGVDCYCVDLHGPNRELHDAIAGTESFDLSMNIIKHVIELGIPLQINTAVSTRNCSEIKRIAEKLKLFPVVLWNLAFTLVNEDELPSAADCELMFQWLYDFSKTVPFDIKTTSGQHFNRVIIQNKRRENKIAGNYIHFADALLKGVDGPKGGVERAPYAVNDGKGMLFISESGFVYPSSMFPVKIGDVRQDSLQEIYRRSHILKKLKNPDLLKDKCGYCEYRNVCGGSRARALLLTKDYLASDPSCIYTPKNRNEKEKGHKKLAVHV